ncbi:MAG: tyrosine--tRNA ligase [Candidatus Nomurabacteria bacterium]|jgi:tyrosyl-tRNA synthetase|nr:tyrosine--tRNA ligase [Candidatus Nomurabacteria bacterium]
MKLSEELKWRGFVSENTFVDPSELDKKTRKFYWGTDPSADSLHIGHLAALMMVGCFIDHGYEPTLLVGGGTGLIGDPKMDKERPIKPLEEIEQNSESLARQLRQLMGEDIKIVNNIDWLGDMGFFKFQGEVGRYFSMTQLMDRDFVKARTGEGGTGLSVAEFTYSLLQGYDFLHLYRTYGIDLQLCGVDQVGNCMSGLHLIAKSAGGKADIWSCPLIIDQASGRKFGKSEGNAVWLSPDKTSPYKFYQYWLNVDDAGVIDYLKIYTKLDKTAVDSLEKSVQSNPAAREAQKTLAYEVTKLVHGEDTADAVKRATAVLFGSEDLTDETLAILERELPTLEAGISVIEALTESGIASSNGDAQRLIKGNAISLNRGKIQADQKIDSKTLLKKGKNQFILIK